MFVKETDDLLDSFIDVSRNPDLWKHLRYRLASTSKHSGHWRSAVDKVESWTLFSKESEPMRLPSSQTN